MDYRISNMVQDTIQLGAKRPQGKSLSCAKLRGFFYGGGCGGLIMGICLSWRLITKHYCSRPTARQHLIFYDNPSRKRVARCTNIFHTGALPTVKGGRQRLSWGFLKQWRGSLIAVQFRFGRDVGMASRFLPSPQMVRIAVLTACFIESLSSVVEIRH